MAQKMNAGELFVTRDEGQIANVNIETNMRKETDQKLLDMANSVNTKMARINDQMQDRFARSMMASSLYGWLDETKQQIKSTEAMANAVNATIYKPHTGEMCVLAMIWLVIIITSFYMTSLNAALLIITCSAIIILIIYRAYSLSRNTYDVQRTAVLRHELQQTHHEAKERMASLEYAVKLLDDWDNRDCTAIEQTVTDALRDHESKFILELLDMTIKFQQRNEMDAAITEISEHILNDERYITLRNKLYQNAGDDLKRLPTMLISKADEFLQQAEEFNRVTSCDYVILDDVVDHPADSTPKMDATETKAPEARQVTD